MESRAIVLSEKQAGFLDDFGGGCEVSVVREFHGVSIEEFDAWLENATFIEQMYRRIKSSQLKGVCTLAEATPLAAQRLAEIAMGKEVETARKACNNILELSHKLGQTQADEKVDSVPELEISETQAAKILKILAEG